MTLLNVDAGIDTGSKGLRRPRLAWRRTFYDGTATDFMACNPNGAGDARVSRIDSGRQEGSWAWRASAAKKIADGVAPNARSAAVASEKAMERDALDDAAVGETGDGYPETPRLPLL